MKRLLVIILVAAGLWAGYWFVGAAGAKRGFVAWFDAQRQAGWQADYADMTLRGFPSRFDTTLTDLRLADPLTGWAWEAPFFQIFALSYRPGHVIAVWPDRHRLSTPIEKFDITSASMQASLRVATTPSLPLERANLHAESLSIADSAGNVTTMTALRMAVERRPEGANSYRIAMVADDLAPARDTRLRIDAAGGLPRTLAAFRAEVEADFDRPWDRFAIETARPQPTRLKITRAEARWGDLELALAGEITIDHSGIPTGQIVLKARNWRDMIDMAVAGGAIPRQMGDQMASGLSLVARLSGNIRTLDIPVDFARGGMSIGPVPLGPAPVIALR